jgi:hypothetical protein
LQPDDIKSEYVTPYVIQELHGYRREGKPIGVELLELLFSLLPTEVSAESLSQKDLAALSYKAIVAGEKEKLHRLILGGLDVGSLRFHNNDNSTPMVLALHNDQDKIAILLFENGAKLPNAEQGKDHYIHIAARYGLLEHIKQLYKHNKTILEVGDSFGQTALIWAAAEGQDGVVSFLIEQGVKLYAKTTLPFKNKMNGATALDWAIERQHVFSVQLLKDAIAPTVKKSYQALSIFSQRKEASSVQPLDIALDMTFETYSQAEEAVSKAVRAYEAYREKLGARTRHWYRLKARSEHLEKSPDKLDMWLKARDEVNIIEHASWSERLSQGIKRISQLSFDEYIEHNDYIDSKIQPVEKPSYFMPVFDDLPTHKKTGWVVFIHHIELGKTVDIAWTKFAESGRSKSFRALGVYLPPFDALPPQEKDALDNAAASLTVPDDFIAVSQISCT